MAGGKAVEARPHARLPPSASKIWMTCAGQPTLAVGTHSASSVHAERGTLAHSVLEQCLRHGLKPGEFVGNAARGTEAFAREDADAVEVAIDFIRGETEPGDEVEIEERLRYSEDLWGTADWTRYRPSNRELLVCDYKHGSGVAVDAIGNTQGVIYAIMRLRALGNRGVDTVRIVIVQPRCYHRLGPVREYVVDAVEMMDWETDVIAAIERVRLAEQEAKTLNEATWAERFLRSGEHCRWCPASATCPRLLADTRDALEADFGAVIPSVGYDVGKLAQALGRRDRVAAWLKAVDEFAYREAARGIAIPGYKLVRKRATPRWSDAKALISDLDFQHGLTKNDTHEPAELKSPAQLRQVVEPLMEGRTKKARTEAAKTYLDGFIVYESSGLTLVPDSDPRAAATRNDPTADFDPVD